MDSVTFTCACGKVYNSRKEFCHPAKLTEDMYEAALRENERLRHKGDIEALRARLVEVERDYNLCMRGAETLYKQLTLARQELAGAYEKAAQHVEGHSCVASCCDAQPSAGEAKALADCLRKNLKPTKEPTGG